MSIIFSRTLTYNFYPKQNDDALNVRKRTVESRDGDTVDDGKSEMKRASLYKERENYSGDKIPKPQLEKSPVEYVQDGPQTPPAPKKTPTEKTRVLGYRLCL